MPRPFLALTLGDPAGCGPWVGVRAALDPSLQHRAKIVLVGDAWVLHRFVRTPGVRVRPIASLSEYAKAPGVVNVLHVPHPNIRSLVLGRPQKLSGESAALAIRTAVGLALSGQVAAMITGPVSKESLKAAALPFPGHTEMLAALSGSGPVEMVLMAEGMRTVLVTRHMPLREVPRTLTAAAIVDSVNRVNTWAREALGIRRPRWVLCGLNPHAGDRGLLGNEEIRVVAPAAAVLRRRGILIDGPLPADSAWGRHRKGEFDFVASLYHDQGMIPLKVVAPRGVINVTAGLPFVRTSPGHGTAFDLAGGRTPYRQADPTPTLLACRAALDMAQRRPRR